MNIMHPRHSWASLLRRARRRQIVRSQVTGIAAFDPSQTVVEMKVRFGSRRVRLLVREGTTDRDLVDMILCRDSEYRLPPVVRPKVIFDIGANIGITAVYYSMVYPEAEVYCFEPLPANLELLRENARRNSNRIYVIPRGLGNAAGSFGFCLSNDRHNFGGGTFCGVGGDSKRFLMLQIGTVRGALEETGVDSVDVFKIDTEGSEWPILRGIPEEIRRNVQAYIGELHGIEDWKFCQMLARTHAVGIQKRYDRRCFPFLALRKDLVAGGELSWRNAPRAVAA